MAMTEESEALVEAVRNAVTRSSRTTFDVTTCYCALTDAEIERVIENLTPLIQAQVLRDMEVGSGKMWQAGRSEFEKYARRYSMAKRHEEAMVICDGAGSEIMKAIIHAYASEKGIPLSQGETDG